jgi:hypothetical protein
MRGSPRRGRCKPGRDFTFLFIYFSHIFHPDTVREIPSIYSFFSFKMLQVFRCERNRHGSKKIELIGAQTIVAAQLPH